MYRALVLSRTGIEVFYRGYALVLELCQLMIGISGIESINKRILKMSWPRITKFSPLLNSGLQVMLLFLRDMFLYQQLEMGILWANYSFAERLHLQSFHLQLLWIVGAVSHINHYIKEVILDNSSIPDGCSLELAVSFCKSIQHCIPYALVFSFFLVNDIILRVYYFGIYQTGEKW